MIFRFCSAAKRTRCRSGFILADWARSCLTSALIGVEVGDWDADSYSDRGTGTKGLLPIGAETIIELSCSQANPRNAARTAAPTLLLPLVPRIWCGRFDTGWTGWKPQAFPNSHANSLTHTVFDGNTDLRRSDVQAKILGPGL